MLCGTWAFISSPYYVCVIIKKNPTMPGHESKEDLIFGVFDKTTFYLIIGVLILLAAAIPISFMISNALFPYESKIPIYVTSGGTMYAPVPQGVGPPSNSPIAGPPSGPPPPPRTLSPVAGPPSLPPPPMSSRAASRAVSRVSGYGMNSPAMFVP